MLVVAVNNHRATSNHRVVAKKLYLFTKNN